jgi:hypothetical protein
MKALVDTSIWSLALRRRKFNPDSPAVKMLTRLIREFRVTMIGPIRQELLSGIRDKKQFERLRDKLRAFPDHSLQYEDYETAAEFFNTCRSKGMQGSNTDFLLCAVAHRHNLELVSADRDFAQFSRYLPFKLYWVET